MNKFNVNTYNIAVIERALAYYEVEAEDARAAAENWQDGEFESRDDEALETEGPCIVRERQPDGSWRTVPKAEWEDAPPTGVVIPAEAHSDDHAIRVEFDALPWFEQATDEAILALARCGWGGDYPADAVAITLAETVPNLARLFAYLEIIANDLAKKDCRGFECRVDEARAMEWLQRHRRAIWPELTGKKPYSVLLLYPDYLDDTGHETYYACVEAHDAIGAVAVAQREAVAAQRAEIDDPTDFLPLLVIAGHHASEPLFNK